MLAERLRAGLGGDNPVTAVVRPAQVSLLGNFGVFFKIWCVPRAQPSSEQGWRQVLLVSGWPKGCGHLWPSAERR